MPQRLLPGAPGPGTAGINPGPRVDPRPPPRTAPAPRAAHTPSLPRPASRPAPLVCDWPGRSPAAADWSSRRASFACGGAGRAAEPRRGSCAGAAAERPSRRVLPRPAPPQPPRPLPGPSGTWLSAASRQDGGSRALGKGSCPLRCQSCRAARGSLGICPSLTFRACPAAWLNPSFLWLGYTARL